MVAIIGTFANTTPDLTLMIYTTEITKIIITRNMGQSPT